MARSQLIEKLAAFSNAVISFEEILEINSADFDDKVADAIDNGKIQKFEYCTELGWKIIKRFLIDVHGIDVNTPKQCVKEFFLLGAINENRYELFLDMLDDRNRLSHIYNEESFKDILNKLPKYKAILLETKTYLEENLASNS